MKRNPKVTKNRNGEKLRESKPVKRGKEQSTQVGDVSESTGIAIGTNAKATVIQIRSIFDLSNLQIFFKNHWGFLALSILIQFSAYAGWATFKDRFLIPAGLLVAEMILLETMLVAFYVLRLGRSQKRIYLMAGFVSLIGLIGLTRMEYTRVIHPPKFDREHFGVAIAQFGEGPDFRNTAEAKEISQLILGRLTEDKQNNPDFSYVEFKSIGLIRSKEEALIEGKRINADLVIWGQLQIGEEATTFNFEILDTPGEVSNPTFQRAMPLLEKPTRGMLVIPSKDSEDIADAATTISGFTFGLAHYFKWDFISAALAFQGALEAFPPESDDYLYLLHLYYGLSLQWPGEYEIANEQFKKASLYHPEDPAAALAMAFGYRYLADFDEARRSAEIAYELTNRYIVLHPDSAPAYFDRALANIIFTDWKSALVDYKKAIDLDPTLYAAYIGVIRMYLETNRPQEAIQAALNAIAVAESNGVNPAWAYLYLGDANTLLGDKSQAELAYQNATSLMPEVDYIHFKAAQFYASEGELDSAESEFKSMIEVTSNKSWAHSSFAAFLADHDKFNESIEQYTLALLSDPDASTIWVALAETYTRNGNLVEAETAFDRGIKVSTTTSELVFSHFSFGNFYYRQGDWRNAISQWEGALEADPLQCNALLNIGRAYENLENVEDAMKAYADAAEIKDGDQAECITEAQIHLGRLSP